jgi:hypothetical protein
MASALCLGRVGDEFLGVGAREEGWEGGYVMGVDLLARGWELLVPYATELSHVRQEAVAWIAPRYLPELGV